MTSGASQSPDSPQITWTAALLAISWLCCSLSAWNQLMHQQRKKNKINHPFLNLKRFKIWTDLHGDGAELCYPFLADKKILLFISHLTSCHLSCGTTFIRLVSLPFVLYKTLAEAKKGYHLLLTFSPLSSQDSNCPVQAGKNLHFVIMSLGVNLFQTQTATYQCQQEHTTFFTSLILLLR